MRRCLVLLGLLVVLLATVAPAWAQSAASLSIRLAEIPTNRQDDPRARYYIVDHVKPGDTVERHVEIGNTDTAEVKATIYAGPATVKGGEFHFGEKGERNELTSWTTVSPRSLPVPAKGNARALVTIKVPEGAVDGERYGVVWAELPPSGGTASVVNRVGIRIYLSVGEGKEPVTDFRIDTLTPGREGDGRPVVRTAITNTGGRAIDLSGSLSLDHGPGSLRAGPFDVEVGTTLGPKEKAPAVVHLDKGLPNGPWDATITVRSGDVVKTAKARITFPTKAGTESLAVKAVPEYVKKQRRIAIPVAAVLTAAALGGVGVSALTGLRGRGPRRLRRR